MYPGIEDLLKVRDGEPVDAAMRAAVDSDPALQAEVARLQATRKRLQDLPAFEPPPGVWEKVSAKLDSNPIKPRRRHAARVDIGQAKAAPAAVNPVESVDAASGRRRLRVKRSVHWPLRGAIAAAAAVVAVLAVRSGNEAGAPETIVAETSAPAGDLDRSLAAPVYASLTSESARLERLLNAIDYQPRLMNAGTATTITSLEDHIALVDQQLMYAGVYDLQTAQAEALWQERVDLMNALLQVRYAQAQRFGF